jgi:hypothetical protein
MTRASQVVRQLGGRDPLTGFESSKVLEYHLPDDVEPVGQNGKKGRKVSSISNCEARYHGNALKRKANSEENGRLSSRGKTACEPF